MLSFHEWYDAAGIRNGILVRRMGKKETREGVTGEKGSESPNVGRT